jgi:hypothetical protein
VSAGQWKIGTLVIKLRDIDAHDVTVTSKVLGVATHAPTSSGVHHAPVVSLLRAYIGGDWLVAVKA